MSNFQGQRAGLSMTEVVVCTLIVGLVLVGSMNGVNAVIQTWEAGESRHDGASLAQLMMSEIVQQKYEDSNTSPIFGNETGEGSGNRSNWDDVDDYHSWSSSPPKDKFGATLTGYTGWTRSTSVVLARLSNPTNNAASDQGLKRITVTVTDPNGHTTTLVAYRSRNGLLEALPASAGTVQTMFSDEFSVGGRKLFGGVHLHNYAD